MNAVARESLYLTLSRISGLALVLVCVLFQRRGLMHWSELVFLGLCIGMQEAFVRVPVLRRLRTPMMVTYSLMPLALVLYHSFEIRSYQGDFVQIVLFTPLPLVLVSVQIMVLYVRESSRLVSVVLVLALFSTVIGVRRPLDDTIWPWLAMIGVTGTLFLMLQHPGMLFHGVYVSRRRGTLPPTGRPGGIMRGAFFTVLPMFATMVLAASLFLYVSAPRIEPQQGPGQGYEVGVDPVTPGDGGPSNTGGPRKPRNTPGPDVNTPASVSGLSAGVDLGDFGEIKRLTTPALDVKLIAPRDAYVQRVYLRAFTYGGFDGERWSPLPTDQAAREIPAGDPRRLIGSPSPARGAFEQREFVITLREAGLGAMGQLAVPTEAYALGGYAGALYYDPVSNTVRAPLIEAGGSYVVGANQLLLSDKQLGERLADSRTAASPRPEYLQVPPALKLDVQTRFNIADRPENRLYDRFAAIVARRGSSDPSQRGVYAAALGIVKMFHEAKPKAGGPNYWTYSLDFRPKAGPDAIARFLDTSAAGAERFGHCEYFASAMCVLMRCYGVPCRVCAGFVALKPDADGVFKVKASAAHAWVEVYFDNWGWVAFDPTPPETDEISSEDPTAVTDPETEPDPKPEPELPEDTLEAPGSVPGDDDWLKNYDREAQQEMFSGVREFFDDVKNRASGFLSRFTDWMPDVLPQSPILRALMLVLPGLLLLVGFVWRRRRRRKIEARVLEQMGEGGRKRQRGLYLQLLLLLAGYGFQKRASETPREFAERVLRKGGNPHAPIMGLTELYYSLRFGLDISLEGEFKAALEKYSAGLQSVSSAPPQEPLAS